MGGGGDYPFRTGKGKPQDSVIPAVSKPPIIDVLKLQWDQNCLPETVCFYI
jgi:hypothetical protein